MKLDQFAIEKDEFSGIRNEISEKSQANIVLLFGVPENLSTSFNSIKNKYPNAQIVCVSATEVINGADILYNSLGGVAIHFEKTELTTKCVNVDNFSSKEKAVDQLVSSFERENLKHMLIFADGQGVNGSDIVNSINKVLGESSTSVTGGLASNGMAFENAVVGLNEKPVEGNIIAIGFYGSNLKIGYGSKGGWDNFGPKRKVTKSIGNELFELDGMNALDLYKKYLGDRASELPGSALLFPLSVHGGEDGKTIVRTVLNISEENQSLIFAGDIIKGSTVQLMKANFDKLVDAAADAAVDGLENLSSESEFSLLISCIGRSLVLGQKVEEEIEAVSNIMGKDTVITGYYSYGEISTHSGSLDCQLHNQTMTITTFKEI